MKFSSNLLFFVLVIIVSCDSSKNSKKSSLKVADQQIETIKTDNITFRSQGINLAGTIYTPENPDAALVIVHGSDSVPRMPKFARSLAEKNILVLTYDKRGVGESGGIYAGPEVGTNNISIENLNLLAKDANAAADAIKKEHEKLPIGLIGFSQAGWVIPIAAENNSAIQFMVIFSGPTITTLEQLRFQFYTNGRANFWDNHTQEDALYHMKNDPDRYQFEATDPKQVLSQLSIPGLWIFGEKDIQIPVKLGIQHLNTLKANSKSYDYLLFPELGHNTAFTKTSEPFDISIRWIKEKVSNIK